MRECRCIFNCTGRACNGDETKTDMLQAQPKRRMDLSTHIAQGVVWVLDRIVERAEAQPSQTAGSGSSGGAADAKHSATLDKRVIETMFCSGGRQMNAMLPLLDLRSQAQLGVVSRGLRAAAARAANERQRSPLALALQLKTLALRASVANSMRSSCFTTSTLATALRGRHDTRRRRAPRPTVHLESAPPPPRVRRRPV